MIRAWSVATARWERELVKRGGPWFGAAELLRGTGQVSLDALWHALGARPFPAVTTLLEPEALDRMSADACERILALAERALRHEVDLLGSGPVKLTERIDWHTDFKTGHRWPRTFFSQIEYSNLDQPSDVKVCWDLSRLHWLIPVGQAYLLTGDERYATAVREVLDQWIGDNPYAVGVNWTCTMEVALRILSWSWLFHACQRSRAWADAGFRTRFLSALWMHGRYTMRHLEVSPVAGNHYTANAAGLVFAGLFFGGQGESGRWRDRGWDILVEEIGRQTLPDGVNHEASVPYHRLVLELFHFPALYRSRQGLPVSGAYRDQLCAMARYTRACVRPDGLVPAIGDGDDARALPFGTQRINDHQYLPPLVGAAWSDQDLGAPLGGNLEELVWVLGPQTAAAVAARARFVRGPAAFPDGGAFILRDGPHYVFVDCGPVGLRGRGGHGHNDCLSVEIVLDGMPLVVDPGSFVYTADYRARNRFRSTDAHNTPRVDDAELNRFVDARNLWNLQDDARPFPAAWEISPGVQTFVGTHTGYLRLPTPVTVWRAVRLEASGRLALLDRLLGVGRHRVSVPMHLAPGVKVTAVAPTRVTLAAAEVCFELNWVGAGWRCAVEVARISPSYGIALPSTRLCWSYEGPLPTELAVVIVPMAAAIDSDPTLTNLRGALTTAIARMGVVR